MDADDLERIRGDEDRSATSALVSELLDSATDDRRASDVGEALGDVADPRSIAPLLALAEDRTADLHRREAAIHALLEANFEPEGAALRAWWTDGDELLQRAALWSAHLGRQAPVVLRRGLGRRSRCRPAWIRRLLHPSR